MARQPKRRYVRFVREGSFLRDPASRPHVLIDKVIHPTRRGRLAMRLIVARNLRGLRALRKIVLGQPSNDSTYGLVNSLYVEVRDATTWRLKRVELDRRYFAVMMLSATKCRVEHVLHECGHAAIYYAQRAKSQNWNGRIKRNDGATNIRDERICYPLGRIASAVSSALHDAGVWK